ncbi:hypothetical protein ASPCADRAFT_158261 [Aspergillus carbonarius ITEM 5010]|uniref:Uncharacterized protein n=1 Tax=Aspergillus carbonarius (strain ITEM 5010) TaxID=602072 RepID=A0A1R3S0V1_ASPC5|nr:hypothetical protein ASPCADRAFT_158261 [Aspergillus carbonarius ITEM 5010]
MFNPERDNGLQYLPAIPFEIILTYLDLESVKALRLTSPILAEKCIGPRFSKCIQQPVLDVSPQNLRNLLALARNHVLSKKVRSLTFLATILDPSRLERSIQSGKYIIWGPIGSRSEYVKSEEELTPEGLANAKSDLLWLKEQQEARAKESSCETIQLLQLVFKEFGNVDSIHLDGMVVHRPTDTGPPQFNNWYLFWVRAWDVFTFVMTAMVQSGVSTKKLDFYRGTCRCCIPAGKITSYALGFSPTDLEVLFKGLQSLELSMSGEIRDDFDLAEEDTPREEGKEAPPVRTSGSSREHIFSGDDPRATLADGTPGITSLFLKNSPALRELNLTFRRTVRPASNVLNSYDRIIDSIARETQFPMLETCAFAGFPAKMASILLFLQKHPDLRSFTMQECRLTAGSWTPIFAQLERSMPRLENLSLANLFGKHMQNLRYAQPRVYFGDSADSSEEAQTYEKSGEREGVGMVILLPIWDTDQPNRQNEYLTTIGRAVHTRTFTREDLRKGLVFRPLHPGPGRPFGSPDYTNWINRRQRLYDIMA